MTRKKQSIGTSIGSALVGFDYAIFRTGKPPAEQVESAKPASPVPADGGGTLTIRLPEDGPLESGGEGPAAAGPDRT